MPTAAARPLLALSIALIAGCALAPQQPEGTAPEARACHEVFHRVDMAIAEAGVADGMAARVAGFPYLRVDRFLASYARDELAGAQFAEWMNRMLALGARSHAIELGNLSQDRAEALAHGLWDLERRYAWPRSAVAECAARLAAADFNDPDRRAALKQAAWVPDDYRTWQRVVGLYWITRIPFAAGVRRWQEETRAVFAQPLAALPVTGKLDTYLSPSTIHMPPSGWISRGESARLVERASANPLGIPDPDKRDLDLLFHAHAPEIVVDTAGEADMPGELGWGPDGMPEVVSRRPVVYRRLSHARYAGRALLQLNYMIWFPERPKSAGWGILAGRLDGVLWRVTLAPDGEPWVYDSIHLCGCYHLFFPTARAGIRPQPDSLDETAFAPQVLSRVAPGARIVLRLAAGTHYLQRVTPVAGPAGGGIEYIFADDDALRSVPLPEGGRRSVYRPDGIVPGTERGERYLFWPMGVPEPGAMRQWGRHATAFIGRRHFDDAGLMERYFTLEQP